MPTLLHDEPDFFNVIRDNEEFVHICSQLASDPAVGFRFGHFVGQLKDANTIAAFLYQHEKHIIWHIHRIWRIRCDIVHSAEYSLNLTLLSGNLEYYLKYLLNIMLEAFCNNKSMTSLTEFFGRAIYSHERLHSNLKQGKLTVLSEFLKEKYV